MHFLSYVGRDGAALAAAARAATPDTPVPSCPEWDLADLLGHVGAVHRWVAAMVTARATERGEFPEPPDDWAQRTTWFDEGLPQLITALSTIGPDDQVWNWAARKPAPATFWPRRMAHETAVHRWDAENAVTPGAATPIVAELAADGIDEYLGFVRSWIARRPQERLHGRLGLGTFTLALHPDHIDMAEGVERADAVVHGTPSDILLVMSGRNPAGVTVVGDQSLLGDWTESTRFN